MSTSNNRFPHHHNRSQAPSKIWPSALHRLGLALLLAATDARGAQTEQATEEKNKNVVAVFRLAGPITEVPSDDFLEMFSAPGVSLRELVARLAKAATDPQVKAVVLLPESDWMGPAQVEELRAALALVRKQGKEVFVHADSLLLRQYVLACGASRISVVPTGALLIPGVHASSLHVRGLLDKIGVKPDFLTEGAYKSAAELFMRDQPSPEADRMMNWLLDSWYARFNEQIADGRKTEPPKGQDRVRSGRLPPPPPQGAPPR